MSLCIFMVNIMLFHGIQFCYVLFWFITLCSMFFQGKSQKNTVSIYSYTIGLRLNGSSKYSLSLAQTLSFFLNLGKSTFQVIGSYLSHISFFPFLISCFGYIAKTNKQPFQNNLDLGRFFDDSDVQAMRTSINPENQSHHSRFYLS